MDFSFNLDLSTAILEDDFGRKNPLGRFWKTNGRFELVFHATSSNLRKCEL
jgi:hypothetical protein